MGKSKRKKQKRKEKYKLQKELSMMKKGELEEVYEGFCFRIDGPDYKHVKELVGPSVEFNEIKQLDDVFTIVDNDDYYAWDEKWNDCIHTLGDRFPSPTEDVYGFDRYQIDLLKKGGTKAIDVWNEYKNLYEPVVGYAYAYLERKTNKDQINAIKEYFNQKAIIENTVILSRFRKGDYIVATMKDTDMDLVFVYSGVGSKFCIAYCEEWTTLNCEDFIDGIDIDADGVLADWSFCDKTTIREATIQEILEVKNILDRNGLEIRIEETEAVLKFKGDN